MTSLEIINSLVQKVQNREYISPKEYVDSAFSLNLLALDEQRKLRDLQQAVAREKNKILKEQTKKNVALADSEIEELETYKSMKNQEDLVDRIIEQIRISKLQSNLI